MECVDIAQILNIDEVSIDHLVKESSFQGFRFVERLIRDYRSGLNCFDKPGEVLLKASLKDVVIGIGGLNQDPYFNDPKVGRLRHLYVGAAWRRCGVGRLLVNQLTDEAGQHFHLLTLRTDTLTADKFYQKLGFKIYPSWEHTTHHLQLGEVEYLPLIGRI